jgi:hypothetical protein
MAKRVRRDLLALVAVIVAYYAAPLGEFSASAASVVFAVVGLLSGLGILVWLIIRQVRLLVDSRPDSTDVRADALVLLIFVIVPVFALGYFALQTADATQFADLDTKTDSLYFTLSTLATVGFGDVHATGQLARVIVMVQIAFDLVFVAAVASVVSSHIRERAAAVRTGAAQREVDAELAAQVEAEAGARTPEGQT